MLDASMLAGGGGGAAVAPPPSVSSDGLKIKDQQPTTTRGALSINSDSCTASDSCVADLDDIGSSVGEADDRAGDDSSEEDAFPSLDPRHLNAVHEELEKLNIATDVINKLELQLDGARAAFREIQGSWSERLKELSKKYGSAIAKARPYYEAKLQERSLREESQRAAIRFERASNLLGVAKQQVSLTQDSLNRQSTVHPECLEVLNHHIQRVSEAENERAAAEDAHRAVAVQMLTLAGSISAMEKEQRSSIKKSRSYFDQRLEFSRVLEQQKALIIRLETEVRQKKCDYTTSLRNLERISDSIHEQRSIGGLSTASSARKEKVAAEPATGHPPPYQPTAPPAYDAHQFEEDDQDGRVLSMLSEETAADWEEKTRRSLGTGVILIAQQLMGGKPPREEKRDFDLVDSQTDVSYRTSLPMCTPPPSNSASSGDSSEVSSLASGRTGMDDEQLAGMLRSHSTLIHEIDASLDRVSSHFKRSVSDADHESGVECGGAH
ncbi:hypothetical protein PFISCL1PPCAC_22445 [Pristionchus fissidentatus]|uniref:SH3 domain-binding protein 5-like n=1 Tax=Pristionchus fissidentatus TaxID=1538716 RepID=A0AAV5WKJ7_9BILA|nr:hypothetical protein PFISCL1PPCAC_22445 [Pristionchus fissidentatus]